MRSTYTGGPLAGEPTATGDSFTNNAGVTATSSPIAGTGETGDATVTDTSSETQTSSGGLLAKEIQPRVSGQDCSADTYAASSSLTPAQTTFEKGDRICFDITTEFLSGNPTLNAVVSDFLPLNTAYESGSATLGPDNTLPAGDIDFDEVGASAGELAWTLGAPLPDGDRQVPPGAVFQVRFSVTVTLPSPPGGPALQHANFAKARATNSAGQIAAFRSDATFNVDPAPRVAITKGVQSVNGQPAGGNPPDIDHVEVREGDTVVFRVDVSNPATAPTSVQSVQTWDVLAPGIVCAEISAISAGGVCTNSGDPGQPPFAQASSLSAVVWNRPASEVIVPGASVTYAYAVTIPSGTSAGADLVDTASVRSSSTWRPAEADGPAPWPAPTSSAGNQPSPPHRPRVPCPPSPLSPRSTRASRSTLAATRVSPTRPRPAVPRLIPMIRTTTTTPRFPSSPAPIWPSPRPRVRTHR